MTANRAQASLHYLLVLMRVTLGVCWCGAAAATGLIAFAPSPMPPLELDPVLAFLACGVSSLAGVTTLAIRINNLMMAKDEKPLVKPWFFAVSHMLGSWLAGVAAFIVARMNGWEPWHALLTVLLLSFMGAKGLEILAEKYLPVIRAPKDAEAP